MVLLLKDRLFLSVRPTVCNFVRPYNCDENLMESSYFMFHEHDPNNTLMFGQYQIFIILVVAILCNCDG